jgi:hypothetical protein
MVTKTTLRRKADKLWSKIILSRGYCEKCGKSNDQLHPHHVIGRRNLSTRWCLVNGICLFAGCHTMSTWSAHQDPQGFMEWYKENRATNYEHIKKEKNEIIKRSLEDYEILVAELEDAWKGINESKM